MSAAPLPRWLQAVRALFLEGNAIDVIEGLGALKLLKCLYLQQNIITDISGLEGLPELEVEASLMPSFSPAGHISRGGVRIESWTNTHTQVLNLSSNRIQRVRCDHWQGKEGGGLLMSVRELFVRPTKYFNIAAIWRACPSWARCSWRAT